MMLNKAMLRDDLYTVVLCLGNQVSQLAADCYINDQFGTHNCLWHSSIVDMTQISCQPTMQHVQTGCTTTYWTWTHGP